MHYYQVFYSKLHTRLDLLFLISFKSPNLKAFYGYGTCDILNGNVSSVINIVIVYIYILIYPVCIPQMDGGWQPTSQSISRIDGLWHVELRHKLSPILDVNNLISLSSQVALVVLITRTLTTAEAVTGTSCFGTTSWILL